MPSQVRAWLAPWDMGSTFPGAGRDEAFWDSTAANLAKFCFADADCTDGQQRRRDALPAAVEEARLPDVLVTARERTASRPSRPPSASVTRHA